MNMILLFMGKCLKGELLDYRWNKNMFIIKNGDKFYLLLYRKIIGWSIYKSYLNLNFMFLYLIFCLDMIFILVLG